MDRKLYEAAMTGNVSYLLESLQEDAAILDRVLASNITETPLHVAALLGKIHFARELLSQKPKLAWQRNSQGLTPLHLASAKGDVEMVKEILPFVSDISLDRDREGRTPLHAAAMKGQVDVLNEFIRIKPDSVRDLTGRGETVLHLCVKHDQLEVLKMLVGSVADEELVNQKDENGNTLLHLSTAMKHIPIMKYLLSGTQVEVNERNGYGLTALDILTLCPSESGDMEMDGEFLRRKGAKRCCEMSPTCGSHQVPEPSLPPQQSNSQRLHEKEVNKTDELRSAVMVVAVLIATVTFQAGLSPPGGIWQDDLITDYGNITSNAVNRTAGSSILHEKQPRAAAAFLYLNTLAFTASMAVIVSSVGLGPFPWTRTLRTNFGIAIFSVQLTYYASMFPLYEGLGSFLPVILLVTYCGIPAFIFHIIAAGAYKLIGWLKVIGRGPATNQSPPGDVEMEARQ